MLIKKLQIVKQYETGFDDPNSSITTILRDLDRDKNIVQGDWVSEKMERYIQGIEIGLSMAGYLVSFEKTVEEDLVTDKKRIIK